MSFPLALLIILIGFSCPAQEIIYFEEFTKGGTKLPWVSFPYYFLDNLEVEEDSSSPGRDSYVGVLRNKNVGGFAALSYVLTDPIKEFHLETYIFCHISHSPKGPLCGIAFLIDPVEGNFFRIVCDFNSRDPSINLAFVGERTRHFPAYLKFWRPNSIPGGIPKNSSWNKIAIQVKNGRAKFFWNGLELEGEVDLKVKEGGYIGVYANYTGGLGSAQTKIDSFIIKRLR